MMSAVMRMMGGGSGRGFGGGERKYRATGPGDLDVGGLQRQGPLRY